MRCCGEEGVSQIKGEGEKERKRNRSMSSTKEVPPWGCLDIVLKPSCRVGWYVEGVERSW